MFIFVLLASLCLQRRKDIKNIVRIKCWLRLVTCTEAVWQKHVLKRQKNYRWILVGLLLRQRCKLCLGSTEVGPQDAFHPHFASLGCLMIRKVWTLKVLKVFKVYSPRPPPTAAWARPAAQSSLRSHHYLSLWIFTFPWYRQKKLMKLHCRHLPGSILDTSVF